MPDVSTSLPPGRHYQLFEMGNCPVWEKWFSAVVR